MQFATLGDLEVLGFEGLLPVRQLRQAGCGAIPDRPGVYAALRPSTAPPQFLCTSRGGHFKGKDPTMPISMLEERWVEGTPALYFGKAGGRGTNASLRRRIRCFMRFGSGAAVGHWGGRAIWQLADADELRIAWRTLDADDPRSTESELIDSFAGSFGRLPFANLTR